MRQFKELTLAEHCVIGDYLRRVAQNAVRKCSECKGKGVTRRNFGGLPSPTKHECPQCLGEKIELTMAEWALINEGFISAIRQMQAAEDKKRKKSTKRI